MAVNCIERPLPWDAKFAIDRGADTNKSIMDTEKHGYTRIRSGFIRVFPCPKTLSDPSLMNDPGQGRGDRKTMNGVAEELEGVGKILQGGMAVGEVAYSIRVYTAGPQGWQYPFARFRERGYLKFYDLLNKPITLILEDGRRWDCRISSLDGTVGAAGNWPVKEGGTAGVQS